MTRIYKTGIIGIVAAVTMSGTAFASTEASFQYAYNHRLPSPDISSTATLGSWERSQNSDGSRCTISTYPVRAASEEGHTWVTLKHENDGYRFRYTNRELPRGYKVDTWQFTYLVDGQALDLPYLKMDQHHADYRVGIYLSGTSGGTGIRRQRRFFATKWS